MYKFELIARNKKYTIVANNTQAAIKKIKQLNLELNINRLTIVSIHPYKPMELNHYDNKQFFD
jgi:hypothetical protein